MSSHCSKICAGCLGTHLAVTRDLSTDTQLFPTGALILGKIIKYTLMNLYFNDYARQQR